MNSTLKYYADHAQTFFDNTHDKEMHAIYAHLLPLIPKHGHILDAGCGSGRDSRFFMDRGYRVTAFDASEEMARLATAYIDQEVACHTFDALDTPERFDAVWAAASLLHLPYSQLASTIEHLSRALKEGGYFYASFKYGDQEYSKEGRHFTCLDEVRLKRLFSELSTLQLVDVWLSDDVRQERQGEKWLNLIAKKDVLQ